MEQAYPVGELPNAEWFERYNIFRSKPTLELIGFCWRYVCIRKLEARHGLAAELIRNMIEYLEHQGFSDPAPANMTLRSIADLVIDQLANKSLNARVVRERSPKN